MAGAPDDFLDGDAGSLKFGHSGVDVFAAQVTFVLQPLRRR